LDIHGVSLSEQDREERVLNAMETSGLAPADHFWDRYPDGLSGGQRQRVVIAGALVLEPELLIADEPVSMLDVSIRAEILNLLLQIREKRNISILYTTHDLATAGYFTDRMAVMYLGKIVEIGPTRKVIADPQHPYTQSLISVIPAPNPRQRHKRVILKGEVPNPIDVPTGCRFHPRCPNIFEECSQTTPEHVSVGEGHSAACLLLRG
jgi:oligopeptide/dipeptide ABC transporter ATP-binding protein